MMDEFNEVLAMPNKLRKLLRDCDGATAIEYGLILALIGVACVGAFSSFAGSLTNMWEFVSNTVDSVS